MFSLKPVRVNTRALSASIAVRNTRVSSFCTVSFLCSESRVERKKHGDVTRVRDEQTMGARPCCSEWARLNDSGVRTCDTSRSTPSLSRAATGIAAAAAAVGVVVEVAVVPRIAGAAAAAAAAAGMVHQQVGLRWGERRG